MRLVDGELSEPYSIFTYRYFISQWPQLCYLAYSKEEQCVGVVVCKMDEHRDRFRGYIAMLVVIKPFRGKGVATRLVVKCIEIMRDAGCDEVILEAEVTNKGALALYGNLGFIRAKRLHRYYLNGADAYRLKLLFPLPLPLRPLQQDESAVNAPYDHLHRHMHGPGCQHDHANEQQQLHLQHGQASKHVHGPGCQHGASAASQQPRKHVHGPDCRHSH
eukprot:SM000019S04937  [mRNA]  locus=s19:94101:95656:+ [translate_table: standard]